MLALTHSNSVLDHERLHAYQVAVELDAVVTRLCHRGPRAHAWLMDQATRAMGSVVLNLATGEEGREEARRLTGRVVAMRGEVVPWQDWCCVRGNNLLLLLVAAALCAGCATFLSAGSARTLDKGQVELLVVPKTDFLVYPSVEVGARYGLVDWAEIGIRAWPPGGILFPMFVRLNRGVPVAAQLESKFQLKRSASTTGVDLALAPNVSYMYFPAGNVVGTEVPLLIGFNLKRGHQFVFGPRVGTRVWINTKTPTWFFLAGASAGVRFKLGEVFSLTPEVALGGPVVSARDGTAKLFGSARFLGGMAFGHLFSAYDNDGDAGAMSNIQLGLACAWRF